MRRPHTAPLGADTRPREWAVPFQGRTRPELLSLDLLGSAPFMFSPLTAQQSPALQGRRMPVLRVGLWNKAWGSMGTVLLLVSLLSLTLFPAATAQQSPALQGQGVPPCFVVANPEASKCPTKVFMSVELLKLLDIDDQNYQFSAILNVQQSWYDPRAEATWRLIEAADLLTNGTGQSNVYNAAVKCGSDPNVVHNLTSAPCEAATKEAPACQKYCTTYGEKTDNPFRCCDALWLPDISMLNLIDTTQVRKGHPGDLD